jgi:hypothetical protein
MKRFVYTLALALTMGGFAHAQKSKDIKVAIDLKDIKDDKVAVTVTPQPFDSETVTYFIPKIIPGTYSEDNYGQFIEGFKAFDKKATSLLLLKPMKIRGKLPEQKNWLK